LIWIKASAKFKPIGKHFQHDKEPFQEWFCCYTRTMQSAASYTT